jgi:hypothetical protein
MESFPRWYDQGSLIIMKHWDVSAIYTGPHEQYSLHPSQMTFLAELESDFMDIVAAVRNDLDYVVDPEGYTINSFSVTKSLSLAEHFADDKYLD